MNMNTSQHNIRVKHNTLGVLSCNVRNKTRLRGYDILDKSRQYRTSVNIANTYAKTYYVKYHGEIIKLKSLRARLKHARVKYYVNSDYTYITIKENNCINSYKITYTNGCIVKHNKIDRKLQHKIYNI